MKRDDPLGSKLPVSLGEESLRLLARRIAVEGDAETAIILNSLLAQLRAAEVVDLWEPREAALTYWILMLSGVNQPDEMQIARDLLEWQAFFAKDSARVLCIQSSERDMFRCCSSTFKVHYYPTLVMSDAPEMHSNVQVEGGLLRNLAAQPGELQRFLARLHALVESGRSLDDIHSLVAVQTFWKGLRVVYKEVKGLISINVATS